ncbi:transcription initiation factor IIB family protein [Haloferax marisrubri]|uniref:Cyclin-like domain-containing protein n=1 Tax=Haloferax marisrubri TaxID=1544719 RepID=A0A2P4NPJ8_9EURY|nr:transcription initiation factor IIB family protein [Haloferax marisrubri]POG55054.1 hypothetical protein AUR65_011535 [Haloferax marisrubri]
MTDVPRGDRMNRVAEELEVSGDSLQTAEMLARQASMEGITSGRGNDTIAAAALLLAVKQSGGWYTAKDIVNSWREVDASSDLNEEFSLKSVLRAEKVLAKEFDIENTPTKPEDLVERYGTELGTPDEIVEQTKQLLTDVRTEEASVINGGRSPAGIAASALYLVVYLNELRLEYTQGDIAEAVGVTEVTIRNTYQDIADALGGKEALARTKTYNIESEKTQNEQDTLGEGTEPDANVSSDNQESTEDTQTEPATQISSVEGEHEKPSSDSVQLPRSLVTTIDALVNRSVIEASSVESFVDDCVRDSVAEHLRSDEKSLPPIFKKSSSEVVSIPIDSLLADMVNAIVGRDEAFETSSELVGSIVQENVNSIAEPISVSVTLPPDVGIELTKRVENDNTYETESDLIRELVVENIRGE